MYTQNNRQARLYFNRRTVGNNFCGPGADIGDTSVKEQVHNYRKK